MNSVKNFQGAAVLRQLFSTGLLVLAFSGACAQSARAEDQFAKGCQLYNAKSYSQAMPIFNETVKKFPKFWPGHYYLANTLLAMGQRSAAKSEYEACMTCQPAPGADTVSACQKVIATLSGGGSAMSGAPAASTAASGAAATPVAAEGDAPMTHQEKEREAQKELILKEAHSKVATLKAELKEALEVGEANANQWYKMPDGSVKTSMRPEQEAVIQQEYQEKINKLQEDAKRRVEAIH